MMPPPTRFTLVFFVLFLPFTYVACTGVAAGSSANPIRRVVTMLQMMQKKVESEGKKEQELYDAFMCYCKSGVGSLVQAIKDADAKVSALESSIAETDSGLKQLVGDIKNAKADRAEAVQTMATAKAIRAKEAQAFAKTSADSKANSAAMGKAVASLEKGQGGAFLQTRAAVELKKLSILMDISEVDRDVLASFLSKGESQSEALSLAPSSGEITGILKEMKSTLEKEIAESAGVEAKAIRDFDALTAAKEKQIATLRKEIESKMVRSGEDGVEVTNQQEDHADTKKSLAEDKKFLIDITQNCQTKAGEKEINDKLRADEMLALADTIKMLNDDDALDLAKETLPSFLQVKTTSKMLKQHALASLSQRRKHHKKDFRLNLIALALKGKKVNFDNVVQMIDDMSALLKKEQVSDNAKKAYCEKNLVAIEDDLKELNLSIDDLQKAIEAHKESIKAVAADIGALTASVKALDKQVADSTAQRKDENAAYKETMASSGAAKELLGMAKNRLAKFYSPKLYKAPAPTAATGGIAGTGITAAFAQYQAAEEDEQESVDFMQVSSKRAPPPPPATAGAYKGAGEEANNGVMSLIDMLVQDLDKTMTQMETEEKEAQKEYEKLMTDSADKRANDSRSISDKEGNKVDLEANTLKMEGEKKGKTKEAMAKMAALQNLHSDCDWLVANHATRKEARTGEIENLTNAKAVLKGADYSF